MSGHLGRGKYEKTVGGKAANMRKGTIEKMVLTDAVGEVAIKVPRDRDGSFPLVMVKKRQRWLGDVDEMVLSVYAKGVNHGGDLSAFSRHLRRVGVERNYFAYH